MSQFVQQDLLSFEDYPSVAESSSRQANEAMMQPTVSSTDPYEELVRNMSSSGQDRPNPAKQDSEEDETSKTTHSLLSIEYYQKFFNVDTLMVIDRISSSIIPKRAAPNYIDMEMRSNPDLYGPIWVSITLIFAIAISGNICNYLQTANDNYHWRYNFHLVSYAATSIFCYAFLVPLALWATLKYTFETPNDNLDVDDSQQKPPSLLSLISVYGYSLAIYIPVAVLWVIQISFVQWLLVVTASFLTGTALEIILYPAVKKSRVSFILVVCIICAHFLLAAGFMLYFFHVPDAIVSESRPVSLKN